MVFFPMKDQMQMLLSFLLVYVLMNRNAALSPDGEALLSFKMAIISSDGVLLQWRQEDPDPCGWKGVTCDNQTKSVIYLSLSFHKLSGSISPDIGKLKDLKLLALHDNNFYGTIPSELGNCSELQALWMGTYDVDQVEITYLKAKWILSFVMLWRKEVQSRLNSGRSKGSEPSKQIFWIPVAGVEVISYVNFHHENMLMHLWSRHGYDYIEFLYKGVKGFEDKKMVNGFNLTMTIQFHRWRPKTSQSSQVERDSITGQEPGPVNLYRGNHCQ